MSRFRRLAVASRVFCLAAIVGLALVQRDAVALQGTILLAAVSLTAAAADVAVRLHPGYVAVAEAALAAAVIGIVLPHGVLLLPYVVVPAMLAGVYAGYRWAVWVFVTETVALGTLMLTSTHLRVDQALVVASPWLLTALGVGLVGAWLRQLRPWPGSVELEDSYESARRLLTELREVARRLSSGLDTRTMAAQLLSTVHQRLGDENAALFMRTEGGVLSPLAYSGVDAQAALLPQEQLIEDCWAQVEPVQATRTSGSTGRVHRIALPLRVGNRMVGVAVADCPEHPSTKAVAALMRELDAQALRLDTALAFDEVREVATVEERQRLAREIHDGVAQEIASLGYVVDDLAAGASSEEQRRNLEQLRSELSRVVSDLRLSIFDLRSEVSPTAGLGSALSEYVREVGTRSGLTVHLTLDEAPLRLRPEVETELFRIAQEAVTNARKHASAANLWVDCRIRPPFARIVVRDDGSGLGAPRQDSFGLRIMRERARRIDAELDIEGQAAPNCPNGTTVTVTVGMQA